MITLGVENYCHNCSRFAPTIERRSTLRCVYLFGKTDASYENVDDLAVVCECRDSCKAIESGIRCELASKEVE